MSSNWLQNPVLWILSILLNCENPFYIYQFQLAITVCSEFFSIYFIKLLTQHFLMQTKAKQMRRTIEFIIKSRGQWDLSSNSSPEVNEIYIKTTGWYNFDFKKRIWHEASPCQIESEFQIFIWRTCGATATCQRRHFDNKSKTDPLYNTHYLTIGR